MPLVEIATGARRPRAEDAVILADVRGCARCGGDHPGLEFRKLARPMTHPELVQSWSHWAPCPTNGEPIAMAVTREGD